MLFAFLSYSLASKYIKNVDGACSFFFFASAFRLKTLGQSKSEK